MKPAAILLCALCWSVPCMGGEPGKPPPAQEPWPGVDDTVVGKFAKAGGRPARKPYIYTDQGDLLLFVFLIAGAAGGLAAGYCFRILFPRKSADTGEAIAAGKKAADGD